MIASRCVQTAVAACVRAAVERYFSLSLLPDRAVRQTGSHSHLQEEFFNHYKNDLKRHAQGRRAAASSCGKRGTMGDDSSGPTSDAPVHQWDVERVCRWAQENRVPEFQAPIRSEEIDGETAR